MAEPSSSEPREPERTRRFVGKAIKPRLSLGLGVLAVLGSVVALFRDASPPAVGAALGFVALLVVLAQIAGRSFLMQVEQAEMLRLTGKAAEELEAIRRNTEAELLAEQKQNAQLELLLAAMKAFNLIEVDSLKALSNGWPTTAFYVQRHATALVEILKGRWNRSEFLRSQQLWYEYKELVTQMKPGETFRSTVCLPSDPSVLFEDENFKEYVEAIYEAAKSQKVQVRRLFVLNTEWPPSTDSLKPEVLSHLRALAEVESFAPALQARVTSVEIAKKHFHMSPPDFMMWGDGLLIVSDLNSPNELVTRAVFDFASDEYSSEILERQREFDALFADAKRALPLAEVI